MGFPTTPLRLRRTQLILSSVPLVWAIDLMAVVRTDAAFRHVADEEVRAVPVRRFRTEVSAEPAFQTRFSDVSRI